jgi:hypothetical protein
VTGAPVAGRRYRRRKTGDIRYVVRVVPEMDWVYFTRKQGGPWDRVSLALWWRYNREETSEEQT